MAVQVALSVSVSLLAACVAWVGCSAALKSSGREHDARLPLSYAGCAGLTSLACGAILVLLVATIKGFGVATPFWLYTPLAFICGGVGVVQAVGLAQAGTRPLRGYETVALGFFKLCAAFAILVTFAIVYTVLAESISFFTLVPIHEFLFGLEWSPQIAIRSEQVGATGSFGVVPLFYGTMLISLIAMLVGVPLGLLSAIYLSEFSSSSMRDKVKPALEFLAGVPTVVYGFFAVVFLGPKLRDLGQFAGLTVSSESALAAGLVIGVMIIPFIASLSEDALYAVPDELRQGSLALGATKGETTLQVVVPAALPGIAAGILLALSRAIGETMIVVMAAGLAANMTANPLESVTTVTVQIVTLLIGDQEFDDPKTLAAFALGLSLFAFTLLLNVVALRTVRKYQQSYE